MKNHKIQKRLQGVAEYQSCKGCGRVHWMWAGPEIARKKYPLAPKFVTEISK